MEDGTIWRIHKTLVILAKELAKLDGKFWVSLSPAEHNEYYAKASNLPRQ